MNLYAFFLSRKLFLVSVSWNRMLVVGEEDGQTGGGRMEVACRSYPHLQAQDTALGRWHFVHTHAADRLLAARLSGLLVEVGFCQTQV